MEAEAAKKEVAACEKEIGAIKTSLRVLGPVEASEDTAVNTLTVAWTKVRLSQYTTLGLYHEIPYSLAHFCSIFHMTHITLAAYFVALPILLSGVCYYYLLVGRRLARSRCTTSQLTIVFTDRRNRAEGNL
jgi:hypothetical protein